MSLLKTNFTTALIALFLAAGVSTAARADVYDDAVAHKDRLANDIKRDPTDKPAEMLRLAGIKPVMQVAGLFLDEQQARQRTGNRSERPTEGEPH